MTGLRFAYAANLLILVPVVWMMYRGRLDGVFEGAVTDSPGLRLLVASLWAAILLASAAGLVWPLFFAPLLLIQIVYKGLWLLVFVLPRWRAGAPIPRGIAACFAAIVAFYPILFWSGVA